MLCEFKHGVGHAALLFQSVGNAGVIVLVKKTLPGRMEADQIAKKVIVRQKAGIDYRFPDWHPALAGGGRREKAGEFVDPRTAIALGQEVVESPHRSMPPTTRPSVRRPNLDEEIPLKSAWFNFHMVRIWAGAGVDRCGANGFHSVAVFSLKTHLLPP